MIYASHDCTGQNNFCRSNCLHLHTLSPFFVHSLDCIIRSAFFFAVFIFLHCISSIMRSFHSLQALRASRTCRTPIQQIRQFHPTRPAPFVNEVLEVSSSFIHGVHAVSGLPWVASIPLTALIVRMTVAMPLQMYTKIQARKEQDLTPLLNSWKEHYQKEIKGQLNGGNDAPMSAGKAVMQLGTNLKAKKRSLHSRWGVRRFWKPMVFLQMPVWLSIMESLRAISGSSGGLVAYVMSLFGSKSSIDLPVEPSLATEGAFWFPDLLAGDPTGILPVALTASILFNIRLGWKVPALKEIADLSKTEMLRHGFSWTLRFVLQILSLNVGAAFYVYEMPTALLIYWITSTNVATAQSFFLDRFMFRRPALKPLKKAFIGVSQPKGAIASKN